MRALLALLLVALPVEAAGARRLAVLELKNRLPPAMRQTFPGDYFTDQLREAGLRVVDAREIAIISRENLVILLQASGKSLADCEGECEVETGKKLGADYVVSGELVLVGALVKASLKLHETHEGSLLAAETASGRKPEELDAALPGVVRTLLAPLARRAAPDGRIVAEEPGGPAAAGELVIVRFETEPEGAVLSLDGALLCQSTPCARAVPPGRRQASAQKERYLPAREAFEAKKGAVVRLRLAAGFAAVRVATAPPGLKVTVDGRPAGAEVELEPGTHSFVVDDPCWAPDGERVTVAAGEARTVTIAARARTGALAISAEDERGNAVEAEASADGKPLGTTPLVARLPLCTAEVVLRGAGGEARERPVIPEKGQGRLTARLGKRPAAPAETFSGPTTARELPALKAVTALLKDNYFDPARLVPQRLLEGAAAGLAAASGGSVRVSAGELRAGSAARQVGTVATLAELPAQLQALGGFAVDALPQGHALAAGPAAEYAMAQGMLAALDRHSSLLTPRTYGEMKVSTRGTFGGIGAVLQAKDGRLFAQRAIRGGPAEAAGLQKGDEITAIGARPTAGMTVEAAAALLRGEAGTPVELTIARAGAAPKLLALKRQTITVPTVESALLAGGVGWLRLASFGGRTIDDAKAALEGLRAQAGGALRGVVLDLRQNPGGLLDQAVRVADLFLAQGTIVATTGKGGAAGDERRAQDDRSPFEAVALAVLADEATASAGEIVLSALRAHGRAVVLGRPTFGKGTVQVIYDLRDGAGLKLTIAQYLAAGTDPFGEKGFNPDVLLEGPERTREGTLPPLGEIRSRPAVPVEVAEEGGKDRAVAFARDVLAAAGSAGRAELLAAAARLSKR